MPPWQNQASRCLILPMGLLLSYNKRKSQPTQKLTAIFLVIRVGLQPYTDNQLVTNIIGKNVLFLY